jgi:tetratricopeptide (TPR) repeat protein
VAETLNNLAGLYQAQSKYDQAEPLYQRSLEILEKVFPRGHPNIEIIKNNYDLLKLKLKLKLK